MQLDKAKAEIEDARTAASRAKVGKIQAQTEVLVEDLFKPEAYAGLFPWPTMDQVAVHVRHRGQILVLRTESRIAKPKVVNHTALDHELLAEYGNRPAIGILLLGFDQPIHTQDLCGPF